MGKSPRRVASWVALAFMGLFSVANGFLMGRGLCRSAGCQVIQKPVLWWLGAFYAAVLAASALKRPRFLPLLLMAGLLVEAGLLLTQVVLGIYCAACLTYGAALVFYAFVTPFAGRRYRLVFGALMGGTGVVAVVLSLLLLSACACPDSTFFQVDPQSHGISLVFEPACSHCHSLLELLRQMDSQRRVRLCPEAWSLHSIWKLVQEHCTTCYGWRDRIRCLMGTAALVRANNRFCMERGYRQVPLLVVDGRFISGEAVKTELFSALQVPAADPFDGSWTLPDSAGACTINRCD